MQKYAFLYSSLLLFVCFSLLAPSHEAQAGGHCKLKSVELKFSGKVSKDRAELSGVVVYGDYLITISNEGLGGERLKHDLQVFRKDGKKSYKFVRDEALYRVPSGGCDEADFEALALDGGQLFAVTSHSVNRKKQKPTKKSYGNNKKRLTPAGIERCSSRYQLRSVKLSDDAQIRGQSEHSLKTLLEASFGAFTQIPNKENGVDIEGLTVLGKHLYVGLRGPVFRQNYTPVLKLDKALAHTDGKVLHVKLNGRGVRGMTTDGDRIIILAGPNGDEKQSFQLYSWNGKNDVGGKKRGVQNNASLLCKLKSDSSGKPEGIAMLPEKKRKKRALLVYDSDKGLVAKIAKLP